MTPLEKLRDRYLNDSTFHAFVDTMRAGIEQMQLTASEMREAAMLASILTEEQRPNVIIVEGDALRFPTEEERRRLDELLR
jgi:hypothetical protein